MFHAHKWKKKLRLMNKVAQEAWTAQSMDCTINSVHHLSLPYETELAKFERKKSPPFFNYGSV